MDKRPRERSLHLKRETRTPPSDQLVGLHLTFNVSGGETGEMDNSGLRGMQHLVRSGRSFLQTFQAR